MMMLEIDAIEIDENTTDTTMIDTTSTDTIDMTEYVVRQRDALRGTAADNRVTVQNMFTVLQTDRDDCSDEDEDTGDVNKGEHMHNWIATKTEKRAKNNPRQRRRRREQFRDRQAKQTKDGNPNDCVDVDEEDWIDVATAITTNDHDNHCTRMAPHTTTTMGTQADPFLPLQ